MKNKYRVILNNKNLAGYFHRTFGVSDDHKIENIRNMARTTARTYPFLNLLIEAWENVDQNDKDFGKIETGFQITFSSAPKTIKIRNFKKSPNKLNYIYILTPKGIGEKTKLTVGFMQKKMKEYEELKKELNKK